MARAAHRAGDASGSDPTDLEDPHPLVDERDRDRAADTDRVDDPRAFEEQEVAARERPDREESAAAFAPSLRDEEDAADAALVAVGRQVPRDAHEDPSHPATVAPVADVENAGG